MNLYRNISKFLKSPTWEKLIYINKFRRITIAFFYYSRIFKEFGDGSLLYEPLLITHPECVEIGNHVHIREGLRLEAITSWNKEHFSPTLRIGDNVSIEQNTNITCAKHLFIGENTTISFNVTITDIDHAYDTLDVKIMQQPLRVTQTTIGECCFIGAGAKILAGTILGRQCIVAANSVVRGAFPDYTVIAGAPARAIKRYNTQTRNWEKFTDA